MTKQQSLILSVLTETPHIGAAEIYLRCKARMDGIGTATVYRNLASMSENGQILRIPVHGEADRYDTTLRPHSHVVCRICGKMRDIDTAEETASILAKAASSDAVCEITVWECCSECAAKRGTAKP